MELPIGFQKKVAICRKVITSSHPQKYKCMYRYVYNKYKTLKKMVVGNEPKKYNEEQYVHSYICVCHILDLLLAKLKNIGKEIS